MNHLTRLSLTFILMFVLSAAAFGEPLTPPCAPGQTESPPCSSQSVSDEPVVPGQTNTPSAEPVVNVTDLTETVMWALSLF